MRKTRPPCRNLALLGFLVRLMAAQHLFQVKTSQITCLWLMATIVPKESQHSGIWCGFASFADSLLRMSSYRALGLAQPLGAWQTTASLRGRATCVRASYAPARVRAAGAPFFFMRWRGVRFNNFSRVSQLLLPAFKAASPAHCQLLMPTFRELPHLPTSKANLSRITSPANFSCQLFRCHFTILRTQANFVFCDFSSRFLALLPFSSSGRGNVPLRGYRASLSWSRRTLCGHFACQSALWRRACLYFRCSRIGLSKLCCLVHGSSGSPSGSVIPKVFLRKLCARSSGCKVANFENSSV